MRDVARNLPNIQNNPSQNLSNLNANINPLNTLSNNLSQLQNINAPTPVAAPNSSLLGVPSNNNLSNLAALSNVVGGLTGLGGVSALNNPLLSSAAAAASLNSLGINLNTSVANDVGPSGQQNMNTSSFNSYNTSGGFNSGNNRNDDMPSFGGGQIRNYNTSNEDYGSRNFGGSSNRKQPSDTILVRNVRMIIV